MANSLEAPPMTDFYPLVHREIAALSGDVNGCIRRHGICLRQMFMNERDSASQRSLENLLNLHLPLLLGQLEAPIRGIKVILAMTQLAFKRQDLIGLTIPLSGEEKRIRRMGGLSRVLTRE